MPSSDEVHEEWIGRVLERLEDQRVPLKEHPLSRQQEVQPVQPETIKRTSE